MAKQNTKSKQGFTIIEVVLVLAIAGLIFLMVFVALPALQRSQRDTQRRNDMARVDTALTNYETNNQNTNDQTNLPPAGKYVATDPTACGSSWNTDSACLFIQDYMNSGTAGSAKENKFQDPDGALYNLVITENIKTAASGNLTTVSLDGNTNSKLEGSNGRYTIGGDSPFSEHVVYIVPGGRCDGSDVVPAEKRDYAVLYRLEGSGTYCIDDM